MSQQHSHHSNPFTQRQFPIHILCDGLHSPANMGSLFRIADAFGVSKITFGGVQVPIDSSRLRRTSRHTHDKIAYEEVEHISETVQLLKQKDYQIIALEITETSKPIHDFVWSSEQKIALLIGSEKNGVSSKLLQSSDAHVHIEMFGENSSMNVVQAAAIALYALTKH